MIFHLIQYNEIITFYLDALSRIFSYYLFTLNRLNHVNYNIFTEENPPNKYLWFPPDFLPSEAARLFSHNLLKINLLSMRSKCWKIVFYDSVFFLAKAWIMPKSALSLQLKQRNWVLPLTQIFKFPFLCKLMVSTLLFKQVEYRVAKVYGLKNLSLCQELCFFLHSRILGRFIYVAPCYFKKKMKTL